MRCRWPVDILSSGESSRLYRNARLRRAIGRRRAGRRALLLEGPSIFFVFGVANQGKDVKDVAKSLRDVIDGLQRRAGRRPKELQKAKNQIVSRLVIGRQTVQEKADAVGAAASLLGDPQRYNTELAKYQAVTAADVQRVIATYLAEPRETRLFITPMTPAAAADKK